MSIQKIFEIPKTKKKVFQFTDLFQSLQNLYLFIVQISTSLLLVEKLSLCEICEVESDLNQRLPRIMNEEYIGYCY